MVMASLDVRKGEVQPMKSPYALALGVPAERLAELNNANPTLLVAQANTPTRSYSWSAIYGPGC